MAKRKQLIQTHFDRLTVVVDEDQHSGSGLHDTRHLLHGVPYRVLATYMHTWGDGTSTPAFLLQDSYGRIVERACTKFKVVEDEEGGS